MGLLSSLKSPSKPSTDHQIAVIRASHKGNRGHFSSTARSTSSDITQKVRRQNLITNDNTMCTFENRKYTSPNLCHSKSDDTLSIVVEGIAERNYCNTRKDSEEPIPETIFIPWKDSRDDCHEETSSALVKQHRTREESTIYDPKIQLSTSSSSSSKSSFLSSDSSHPRNCFASSKTKSRAIPLKEFRRSVSETSKKYVHVYHDKLMNIPEEDFEMQDRFDDDCSVMEVRNSKTIVDGDEMKERWMYSLKIMHDVGVIGSGSTKQHLPVNCARNIDFLRDGVDE